MHESFSSYLKIIPFAIKNKHVLEFINLEIQKDTDRFRKNRFEEYINKEISSEDAIAKLFPNEKFDLNILNDLENHLNNFLATKKDEKYPSVENPYPVVYGLDRSVSRLLYFFCFLKKPNIVVETGVANGISSSYILYALDQVKNGKLFSIDGIVRPWHTAEKIGLAIPQSLRTRQKLIIGNSSIELKKLLTRVKTIDIFIHDSSHIYQNMKKEFKIAWPYINDGGFLFSDDVSQHDAFLEFSDSVGKQPLIIKKLNGGHFGIIKK